MVVKEAAGAEILDARQAVYQFLRAALTTPSLEQYVWMRDSAFAQSLHALGTAFGVNCPEGEFVPDTWPDHESRYLACFEVGLPTPPVPLLASHYQRREPVPRVIHEHILFYRRFGMRCPEISQAPADHLVYQLAFLIHLDQLLLTDRFDADSLLWARRDFLARHMHRWIETATRQANEKRLPEVYRVLLALLAAAVAEDLEWTTSARLDLTLEAT